jgi:hypothetical protein
MPDHIAHWYGAERLQADRDRVQRFWAGAGRALATLMLWPFPYRQSLDDATMLDLAPRQLEALAALPGLTTPCFHADFGTVSMPRYWGGERYQHANGQIHIRPMARTLDEALALEPAPVDDPDQDAAHALRLWRALSERLETEHLWLRTPDFQGVLNTAGLIMDQQELLMALLLQPDLAHEFLRRVCDHLIAVQQYLRRETNGRICGNIWPDTFLPAGVGLSLTEDLMPLLSAEALREFALPGLRRYQECFGGLHIHCCGDYGRHAETLAELNITAVEFHHPLTTIEQLAPLAAKTVSVPMLNGWVKHGFRTPLQFFEHLLATTPEHYRYWFILGEDTPEGREFVERISARLAP